MVKQIFSSVIYENPLPQLRARNAAFPGICRLNDGSILAVFQIGEAFESVDGTSYSSVSRDGGRTWSEPKRLFDKKSEKVPLTDVCKPAVLPDGRVMVFGYRFFREDPELPIGNPKTGGLLPDEIFYSISSDGGESWSEPISVDCAWKNSVEASAPVYALADGSLASPVTGFPRWDGSLAGRNCGRLIRSYDGGRTWNDDTVCTAFAGDKITCFEQRLCQTDDGTIIVISWNENMETGERMNNHITLSRDNGKTFGEPIDTGIRGQASSLLSLGKNRFLSIHSMRRDTDRPGILFSLAEIRDGRYVQHEKELVWTPRTPIARAEHMAEIFAFLKFGQPGAIKLPDGKILMTHWYAEDGVYKVVANCYELGF